MHIGGLGRPIMSPPIGSSARNHISAPSQSLSCRQQEVLCSIRERLAPLNVPIKIDEGRQFDCGHSLMFTGFAKKNNAGDMSFVIGMSILNDMSECESAYHKFMAKIDEMVRNQQANRNAGVNLPANSNMSIAKHYIERIFANRNNNETCILNIIDLLNQRCHGLRDRVLQ